MDHLHTIFACTTLLQHCVQPWSTFVETLDTVIAAIVLKVFYEMLHTVGGRS